MSTSWEEHLTVHLALLLPNATLPDLVVCWPYHWPMRYITNGQSCTRIVTLTVSSAFLAFLPICMCLSTHIGKKLIQPLAPTSIEELPILYAQRSERAQREASQCILHACAGAVPRCKNLLFQNFFFTEWLRCRTSQCHSKSKSKARWRGNRAPHSGGGLRRTINPPVAPVLRRPAPSVRTGRPPPKA